MKRLISWQNKARDRWAHVTHGVFGSVPTSAGHRLLEHLQFDGMDTRMFLRRVVDEENPAHAPDQRQTALDVEDSYLSQWKSWSMSNRKRGLEANEIQYWITKHK